MKKIIISLMAIFPMMLLAQNTTISRKSNEDRELSAAHKAMIIPFEPKLYMSEIDQAINRETKLSAKEIKFKFRNGLNEEIYKAFKTSKYNVLDLMEDTAKYRKDIENIYQYLSYDYQKVPNQENYKAPEKEKTEKKINKGQLVVETNSDARFMNAKITNAKLVPTLYNNYKTDLFVFINELELKAAGSGNYDAYSVENAKRQIIVHYTIFTYDGKEINSGIASEEFDSELNNPKKIIEKHFAAIAATIVARLDKQLLPKK
jgi:hypothetical protein